MDHFIRGSGSRRSHAHRVSVCRVLHQSEQNHGVSRLPGRALESILQLLEVFLISTVALIPRQPEWILAVEFLAIGIVSWVAQVIGLIRYLKLKAGHPRWWFVLRAVLSQLAAVPFLVAGITLLFGMQRSLYWLAPGFVFSFVASIVSAWVLLVEILR